MFSSDLSREAVKYDEWLVVRREGEKNRLRAYVHASTLAKRARFCISSCRSVSQPCSVSAALMKVCLHQSQQSIAQNLKCVSKDLGFNSDIRFPNNSQR